MEYETFAYFLSRRSVARIYTYVILEKITLQKELWLHFQQMSSDKRDGNIFNIHYTHRMCRYKRWEDENYKRYKSYVENCVSLQ